METNVALHKPIENELEDFLAGRVVSVEFRDHLGSCGSCRGEVDLFAHQARMIRALRVSAVSSAQEGAEDENVAPVGGFYARVMQRIETMEEAASPSIWTIFLQPFGQRLAFASLALFAVLSGVLFTMESQEEQTAVAAAPQAILAEETLVPSVTVAHRITGNDTVADRNAVLTQLVTLKQ
jgi:predicted anti-sigma-YlaC factor YlaD